MRAYAVDDPREFFDSLVALAGEFEARHNLIFAIAGRMVDTPDRYEISYRWLVEDDGDHVCAAVMTPPWRLLLADEAAPGAAALLAAEVADAGVPVPGAIGNRPTVDRFVAAWTDITDAGLEMDMAQGVFALEAVRIVPEAPGEARPATESDRELLIDWIRAFEDEAFASPQPGSAEDYVDRRLRAEDEALWIWELDGSPVSVTGHGGLTPNGIRIGPVYTPPQHRGRGFATSLVAEQSAWLLDQGYRFCFLFTDLANPTSNAIYERIGYEQITEAATYRFT